METEYEIISATSGDWVRLVIPEVPSLLSLKTDLPKYVPVFRGFRNTDWVKSYLENETYEDSHSLLMASLQEAAVVLPFLFPLSVTRYEKVESSLRKNLTGGETAVMLGLSGSTVISLFDGGLHLNIGEGDLAFIPGGPLFRSIVDTTNSALFVGYATP